MLPRIRRHSFATAAAFLLCLTWSRQAHAGRGKRAVRPVVVSFAGELRGELTGVPERLARVMADVVGDSGARATRAPLEDILALVACAEATDDCLRRALDLLEARSLILGEVELDRSSKVAVRLRLIVPGRPARSRRLILTGDGAPAIASGFRGPAAAFWRDPEPPEMLEPRDTPAVIDPFAAPAAEPSPAEGSPAAAPEPSPGADLSARPQAGFSASRVEPLSWGVAAGGAGMVLAGSLLLVAAADKQDEVAAAPASTVEELEALASLEASGRNYSRWGGALLMVGAVAATVGVSLVIKQGGAPGHAEGATVVLSPSVGGSGLGATLTVRGGP